MILYQHWYDTRIFITGYDIIYLIIILFFAIILSVVMTGKKTSKEPLYKYLAPGLLVKVFAALAFALITMGYYPGDTFEYFMTAHSLNKMLLIEPSHYFDIFIKGNQPEFYSYFNHETLWPSYYIWKDPNSVIVARIFSPLMLISNESFLISTIIAALIGFSGIWKLYVMFCRIYPGMEKRFAYAILFFPSLLFWSSGILKDTITISALGWFMYSFYNFAILKRYKIKYAIAILVASILIINIKSYIFAALLPGVLIWFFFDKLSNIKSNLIKFVFAPFLFIIVIIGFLTLMSGLSAKMGAYGDVDSALKTAQITQQDLIRGESYGENYYDIGKFEATPAGVASKFPIATISGIYRPFIWEARNPFIMLAALESLFMMGFLAYCIIKLGFGKFFKTIISDPLLIFSFIFIIFFGFGVGLATANFGALVRYKIPLLPFYMASVFIILNQIKVEKKKIKGF